MPFAPRPLLGLSGRGAVTQEQANTALDRLDEIQLKIESLKASAAPAP